MPSAALPRPRRSPRPLVATLCAALVLACPAARGQDAGDFDAGFESVAVEDIEADLAVLAGPQAEGRDSPSAGLTFAGDHIIARLTAAGFTGAGPDGAFRIPFVRALPAPVPEGCQLIVDGDDGPVALALDQDYTPIWLAHGAAEGEVVVLGFGIDSDRESYDDVTGDLAGTIALIVSGEPRHKRRFDGPELSPDADVYAKLTTLAAAGVAGALVVRRPPPAPEPTTRGRRTRGSTPEPEAPPPPATPFGFRHTRAVWRDEPRRERPAPPGIPALEITPAAAQRVAGFDVLAGLDAVDRTAKAPKPLPTGRRVAMAAETDTRELPIDNIAAVLPGRDPELRDEYIVLGAHYDHVGVDERGRIAYGADDNASGSASMLAVARALALAQPRRSILACAFAGEEDGLIGSDALAESPPVPREALAAMVNIDMLGFGDPKEVAVIGVPENPGFGKLLKRAKALRQTKVSEIVTGQGQEVFQRSDHYSFHKRGVPAIFFFEGLPVGANPHYHRWTDTIDTLDTEKLARSSRLIFNTVWLLAEDDERPPPPEHTR